MFNQQFDAVQCRQFWQSAKCHTDNIFSERVVKQLIKKKKQWRFCKEAKKKGGAACIS